MAHPLPQDSSKSAAGSSGMTFAEFVDRIFVPEHVAAKELPGRIHYQAILKHILTPEEVDRIFQGYEWKASSRLKTVPGWPYLGALPLREVSASDVQRLIAAASARNYSAQTVKHVRAVISAIIGYARRKHLFVGDNPAELTTLPKMTRKEAHEITPIQARELFRAMQHPEKEMALLSILTGMNLAEICGLQWKHVNLTETWSLADRERIPPRTIAVRKQWYRGALADVNRRRRKDLQATDAALKVLEDLRDRSASAHGDDFVLASPEGKPVNERTVALHRLRPLGLRLHMPWLSWQVLRRSRKSLLYELGTHVADEAPRPEDPSCPAGDTIQDTVFDRSDWTGSFWMQLAPSLRATFGSLSLTQSRF